MLNKKRGWKVIRTGVSVPRDTSENLKVLHDQPYGEHQTIFHFSDPLPHLTYPDIAPSHISQEYIGCITVISTRCPQ